MNQRDETREFEPKFGPDGLLTAIVVEADSNTVLMVAHMNDLALKKTQETGFAHFHSRSRNRLWMKGESSGNTLRVTDILVDCDQDALLVRARPDGPACHTGRHSCFYRRLEGQALRYVRD